MDNSSAPTTRNSVHYTTVGSMAVDDMWDAMADVEGRYLAEAEGPQRVTAVEFDPANDDYVMVTTEADGVTHTMLATDRVTVTRVMVQRPRVKRAQA